MMKAGTRVRMSDDLKRVLRGKCGEAGHHLGPFWPEAGPGCHGCSSDHVNEFGDCVGIVQEITSRPEIDVRWQPSNLRYSYKVNDLVKL